MTTGTRGFERAGLVSAFSTREREAERRGSGPDGSGPEGSGPEGSGPEGRRLTGAGGPDRVPGRVNAGSGGGRLRERSCPGVRRTIVTTAIPTRAAIPKVVKRTRILADLSC